LIDITIPSQEPKLGIQKKYDKLVRQWGRELANEIMTKRASRMPTRKGKKHGGGGSPILPGSFESGKRR